LNTRPDLIATYISCDQVASGATQRRWLLAAAGWVRVETRLDAAAHGYTGVELWTSLVGDWASWNW
jgi:hypothetical protein